MNITATEFELLRAHLLKESGIDVPEEKQYLFTTRLTEICKQEKCENLSSLYKILISQKRPQLMQTVIEAMTTHESGFMRDGHPFDVLTESLLPKIALRKKQEAQFLPPRIRILSAGCSFGQEPYSMAICMCKWLLKDPSFLLQNISIMGIDISQRAIEVAKKGSYTELELGKQLSVADRTNYFAKEGDRSTLIPDIRKLVQFKAVNLSRSFGELGKFDVVFCRNVIIYFPRETKLRVLEQLRATLDLGGVLFLGSTESMYHLSTHFEMHKEGATSYYTAREPESKELL